MVEPYESRLNRDLNWALDEGSRHFDEANCVHRALRSLSDRMRSVGICHAVAGDLAMFFHGYRRFSEVIEFVISKRDRERAVRSLTQLGYSVGDKAHELREPEWGVKIKLHVSGESSLGYITISSTNWMSLFRVPCLSVDSLLELKLAVGQSGPGRLSELSDVMQMIQTLELPRELAEQLNPSVRSKYEELWDTVDHNPPLE